MIAFLEGKIAHISTNSLILNVGGVGYRVFVAPSTLSAPLGTAIKLYTYHKSSDDGQALFGFPDAAALDFFELLLTVSGIGPKSALSIVSAGETTILQEAIAKQDSTFFSQMGGIGKKTAERIIVELKDKVGHLPTSDHSSSSSDIFDALIGLGYSTHEVKQVVSSLDRTLPAEEQIKRALKQLSSR